MTGRIEKTVFISYRRTNFFTALAVYQDLTLHGYDVFFDYQSINSGDFEKIITENIKAKAHFLIILSSSAIERFNEPGDWLRYEIELAMNEKRNIIPLIMEGFDFGSPSVKEALTGKLAVLNRYNGLRLVADYFFEGMEKLRGRYLNIALEDVPLSSLSENIKEVSNFNKTIADKATPVGTKQLNAEEWFERGKVFFDATDIDEALRCYTEAVNLNSKYVNAYFARGFMYELKEELDKALQDYNIAIDLETVRTENAIFYAFRGDILRRKDNLDEAMIDFNKAILLNPRFDAVFIRRAVLRISNNDLDAAISDLNEAIRLDSNQPNAYYLRAFANEVNKNYQQAISDYQKHLEINGKEKEIEDIVKKLKRKLAKKKPKPK